MKIRDPTLYPAATMPTHFLCLGNANLDLLFPLERLPEPHQKIRLPACGHAWGGAALNTAHWLRRLGAEVGVIAALGDDAIGAGQRAGLIQSGIDVSGLQTIPGVASGVAAIFSSASEKRMVIADNANGRLDPGRIDWGRIGPDTHLHISFGDQAVVAEVISEACARGATISLEHHGEPPDLLEKIQILFINGDDFARRFPGSDAVEFWRGLRHPDASALLVSTQGAEGARAMDAAGRVWTAPTPVGTNVVDRTGGGDAFDAGFLHGWAGTLDNEIGDFKKRDYSKALRRGLALAARVIAQAGARPEIDLTDLEEA